MSYFQRQRMKGESTTAETTLTVERVLQDLCTSIALPKNLIKRRNYEIRQLVEDNLIKGLKSDALFAFLYQNIYHMGSFYEGLKVDKPDEFDLNIVMTIPVPSAHLMLNVIGGPPGHLKIQHFGQALETMPQFNMPEFRQLKERMLQWCSLNGTLLQSKFLQWFIGLVHSYIAVHKIRLQQQLNKSFINLSVNGPAVTLKLDDLSIDLVPAFEFSAMTKPPRIFRAIVNLYELVREKPKYVGGIPLSCKSNTACYLDTQLTSSESADDSEDDSNETPDLNEVAIARPCFFSKSHLNHKKYHSNRKAFPWFVVPKPYEGYDEFWRVSFSRHERELLHSVGVIKPAIRLIKKLRDTRKWAQLSSYAIKTVALWEISTHEHLCRSSNLDQMFFHLLNVLQERIMQDSLMSLWDSRLNLLDGMLVANRINIANELRNLVDHFERNRYTSPHTIANIINP